jgi:hypothetical protein
LDRVDCDEFESDDEYNTEHGLLLGEDVFIQVLVFVVVELMSLSMW